MMIKGKALLLTGNISADEILHSRYAMLPDEEMAEHVFEDLGEAVTGRLKGTSVIVGGRNFGCGTGRESSARSIRAAGFRAIIADSFARIFYRNAINQGIAAIECQGISAKFGHGDDVEIDMERGSISDKKGNEIKFSPFPGMVQDIILAGGVVNYGKKVSS